MASGAGWRVLVVDDEPAIRLLCRVNLALEGFDVIEAADGETALDHLALGFEIVLLDLMLPGLSGLDVAERIRANPQASAIPIVLMSATADQKQIQRGLEAGAVEFISKPFDPSLLGARLSSLLETKEQS
jgi:DNA-binding response OmpR family regulator